MRDQASKGIELLCNYRRDTAKRWSATRKFFMRDQASKVIEHLCKYRMRSAATYPTMAQGCWSPCGTRHMAWLPALKTRLGFHGLQADARGGA